MKMGLLHIGLKVKHPQYGVGVIKGLSEHAAEVRFDTGTRMIDPETSGIQPTDPSVSIQGLEVPLASFLEQVVELTIQRMGWEKPDTVVEELGARWQRGRMVLYPSSATLQPKEVPLETWFHKVVMMRNNLRVLEQKINAHPQLTDADKVEMQQYISRCHGSMTTFNLLFKEKSGQFESGL
jgi:hypothetical protein